MSRIFEALQRSEVERSSIDLAALAGATEMLQRSEHRAASKWETAVRPEQPDATTNAEHGTAFGLPRALPVATAREAPAATKLSLTDEHLDLFGQFQSLQVLLTPQSRLVCLTDSGSPAAEAFRLLGVRLRHLRRDRPLKK